MNVNVWDVLDEIRPLITSRTVVDADKLADPDTAYSDVGR
jgi:3-phenylpropionate/trans-cinnamate dioxygenase ferredoxin reductase subunit